MQIKGTFFDTGATQDAATLTSTMLLDNTAYNIYAVSTTGTSVEQILSITTDAAPTTLSTTELYGMPRSRYSYTYGTEFILLKGLFNAGNFTAT